MAFRRSREDLDFPAAPTNAPAAPAPAPAPGGQQDWTQPSTVPGLEERFAAQRGNVDWRDPSYSQAQWGAWEAEERQRAAGGQSANQQKNKYTQAGGGCPPDKPFTSRPGPDGSVECAAKPDDCPDGSHVVGTPGRCVPNEEGPGGGPGGGGPGGGGDVGTAGAGAGSELSSLMEGNLKGMLAGGTRYDPATMQGLLAAIKQRIESSKGTQLRQAESEAAGRGMSRSGRTGTNLAAIRRGAESQFTSEYANTLRAKIDADRQDKLDALDRSQRYLDSMRDELYRRDMSAIQRQQFKANLDLAYANIRNQRESLASQQQYGKDMLAAQYGYGATFGGM